MPKARLIDSKELAPETRHFEFEVQGPAEFHFTPGQFISILHSVAGKEITRAYSIASPRSTDNRFALCLNRVSDGLVSPYLFALRPGDEIDIQEPLGFFTLRHPGHRVVFVATGTGIAPFRSMLLEHLSKGNLHITLLFGARYEHGLLYRDEFEELAATHSHFQLLPTVTRPGPDWTGRTGRVQAHLEEALQLTSYDRDTIDVYICGLKEMVDDVRKSLKARGFDRKQIIYEKYD
ncbi:MAG TPA: FAD-binding oxidoreductase [Bryobacteraceae bacterium]|jgi:ferredoxin-NADP reductase|nr:FAD-binding oxidoreductase [Bryobacteraceae bacterium]